MVEAYMHVHVNCCLHLTYNNYLFCLGLMENIPNTFCIYLISISISRSQLSLVKHEFYLLMFQQASDCINIIRQNNDIINVCPIFWYWQRRGLSVVLFLEHLYLVDPSYRQLALRSLNTDPCFKTYIIQILYLN